jgi:ABC-2 type transport system permease protein
VKIVNKLGSVIRFTFRSQTRTKSYKIGTVFFIILITIGIHVPLILQAFNPGGEDKVAVLPSATAIPAALQAFYEQQEDSSMTIILLEDQGSQEANEQLAKQMLFDGKIDGYLIIREDDAGLSSSAELKAKDIDSGVLQDLQMALQLIRTSLVAERLELTGDDLLELNRSFSIEPTIVTEGDEGKSEEEIAVTFVFVIIMLTLLFMSIFGGGTMVATEVSSEKSSRVMEILITSVKPLTQMFGKLIGIFLVGLVQMLIYIATAAVNLMLPHNRDAFAYFNLDLSGISASLVIYFILFYLLGYFSYAVMFAAAGSLVSRNEDVGQVISPFTVISLAVFYVAIFSISNTGAAYVEILSFVPLFSPILMFMRIGVSNPAIWEVGLAIVINAAFILLVGWFAAKIYRAGVLMYGKKPALKEVWKAMRYR